MALVFNHIILHEGEALLSGVKYIMRSDIMFQRQDPPNIDPKEQLALSLLSQAQSKEKEGQFSEATEYYKRAFRLWPALEFNV